MAKLLLLISFAVMMFYALPAHGQFSNDTIPATISAPISTPATDTISFPLSKNKWYTGFFFTFGQLPVIVGENTWTLSYLDDSPSRDYFYGEKTTKAREVAYFGGIGYHSGIRAGGHFEISGKFMLSDVSRNVGSIGLGYNLLRPIIFRPVVSLEIGSIGFDMGSILNNSLYIQVNDQLFYSNSVPIRVVAWQAAVAPRIDIGIPLSKSKDFQLLGSLGYNYTLRTLTPSLKFSGEDEAGESVREYENLYGSNVAFQRNGEPFVGKLPFETNGVFWYLTLSF